MGFMMTPLVVEWFGIHNLRRATPYDLDQNASADASWRQKNISTHLIQRKLALLTHPYGRRGRRS
jgi:hypothetical protein